MRNKYINLNSILSRGRPPQTPLIKENGETVTWKDFSSRINCLKTKIENQTSGSKRWLLYSESSLGFSTGLFACWASGCRAVLPPDIQKGSIAESTDDVEGIITDADSVPEGIRKIEINTDCSSCTQTAFKSFNPDFPCLELFTSGSTGKRKSIVKNFSHLSSEIDVLESMWGDAAGSCEVYSTVSHQHIYGLLHKVLWPLCAGRVFYSKTWFFPETLLKSMEAGRNACLVSGPAHLKRINKLADLSQMESYCRIIFSSGGLLDSKSADALRNASGIAPIEILGSTETGGIAWRSQKGLPQSLVWEALNENEITEINSCLAVKSPFISVSDETGWFVSNDKIEMLDERHFNLLGRSDRIVKIEEKRISLDDIEKRLKNHEYIKNCKAFTSNITKHNISIVKTAAAVILNAEGKSFLEENGRRRLIKILRKHVSPWFPSVALPRYWRFIEKMPEDSQGKTTEPLLRKLL